MKEFTDKVVVITGAGSGIGAALAEAFAREKARLVLADIADDSLETTKARVRSLGAEVCTMHTDVADSTSVDTLAHRAIESFGAVHIVCNNAGVGQAMRPVWDFPLDFLRDFFDIDFWGVVHGIRTFVPLMLRQGDACHIVNTASLAGVVPYPVPYHGPYNAAKAAVIALSESLSADLRRADSHIRVSVLCPAVVRTNIMNFEFYKGRGLPSVETTENEVAAKWMSGFDDALGADEYAKHVLEGIRDERLYILSNPEFDFAIRDRTDDMIMKRNPTLLLP